MEQKDNEGSSKFHFVESEEKEEIVEEQIEESVENKNDNKKEDTIKKITPNKAKEEKQEDSVNMKTLLRDSGEDTDTQLFNTREMAIIKENLNDEKQETKLFNKFYFGYKCRVALLMVIIIICFSFGFFFIYNSLNTTRTEDVQYIENADATYKICVQSDDPYLTNCIDYNDELSMSNTKSLKINLSYLAKLEKASELNLVYHVMAINRIYDKFDSSKILYENKDIVIADTPIEFNNELIADVDKDYTIDLKKYNDFVLDYQTKYPFSSEAALEIVTFITEGTKTYEIGSINVPLGVDKLTVYKNYIKQEVKTAKVSLRDWTNKSTWYIILGSVLILLSIFALVYLTKLVLATLDKKSKYEKAVMDILTTYDRIIVEARDGYESNIVKKVIKVPNFDELLDAREVLNKPIIYSRINNVKCEFIVEDEDKLYKYVLKEVDVEKE